MILLFCLLLISRTRSLSSRYQCNAKYFIVRCVSWLENCNGWNGWHEIKTLSMMTWHFCLNFFFYFSLLFMICWSWFFKVHYNELCESGICSSFTNTLKCLHYYCSTKISMRTWWSLAKSGQGNWLQALKVLDSQFGTNSWTRHNWPQDGQVPPAARRLGRHKTRCCMKNAFVVIAQSVLLTTEWLCRTSGSTENLHSRFHSADKLIDDTKASCFAIILNTANDWHHCTLGQVFQKNLLSTKVSVFTCGTSDDPLSLVRVVGQLCFRSTAGTSVIQNKFSKW